MKYSEKLRDPRWQKKRLEVMQRDGFACMVCDDAKSTLNVHHKQYHGDPWEAALCELETLCERCHKKRTDLNKFFLSISSHTSFGIFNYLRHYFDPAEDDGGTVCYFLNKAKLLGISLKLEADGLIHIDWPSGNADAVHCVEGVRCHRDAIWAALRFKQLSGGA